MSKNTYTIKGKRHVSHKIMSINVVAENLFCILTTCRERRSIDIYEARPPPTGKSRSCPNTFQPEENCDDVQWLRTYHLW
jgi:hypothetical protein